MLLGGLWAAGAIANSPTLTAIGKDGVEASLFSVVLIAPVLKKVVGRARPDEGLGSTYFDPFSEFESFPSGERRRHSRSPPSSPPTPRTPGSRAARGGSPA